MKLVRTFHPVGHGAFYTERFGEDNSHVFTVIYDCGQYEAFKSGTSLQSYKASIEDYLQKGSGLIKGDKIDLLFLSHFHTDHINGVDYILKNFKVAKIILPVITPLMIINAIALDNSHDVSFLLDFFQGCLNGEYDICEIDNSGWEEDETSTDVKLDIDSVQIPNHINAKTSFCCVQGLWKYIPFYNHVKSSYVLSLEQKLKSNYPKIFDANGNIVNSELLKTIKKNGVEEFKALYTSVFGDEKHNSYSMTLYSGCDCKKLCHKQCHIKYETENLQTGEIPNSQLCRMNCLYMGDYEALSKNGMCSKLQSFYKDQWEHIGVMQVPHHGSEKNSCKELYLGRERLCIISVDSNDKYRHPDQVVIEIIQESNSIPILVTEKIQTRQVFTVDLGKL